MSWTAKLTRLDWSDGLATMTQTYESDDGRSVHRTYGPVASQGTDWIHGIARQAVRNLEALDTWLAETEPQIGKPIDTTPPDKPKADADRDAFFELYFRVKADQIAQQKGLLASDDAAATKRAADMKAAFLPEYTTDARWS